MLSIRKYKQIILPMVLMLMSVALLSCGSDASDGDGSEKKGTPVTLQLNWKPEPQFGGYYAALQDKLDASNGLNLEIKAGGPGTPTWPMVAQGKVDFAIVNGAQLLEARANGADLVAIFALYQSSPRAIMVHEETGITNLSEVFTSGKIKTMMVEPKLAYVTFMKENNNTSGIDFAPYTNSLAKFYSDKSVAIQCFMSSEPVKARLKGLKVKAFSVGQSGYNPYDGVVVCTRKMLEEDPEKVKKFVATIRAGWEAYMKDAPKYNVKIAEMNLNMSVEEMNIAAAQDHELIHPDQSVPVGSMTASRWMTLAQQLVKLERLTEEGDVTKAFEWVMLDQ